MSQSWPRWSAWKDAPPLAPSFLSPSLAPLAFQSPSIALDSSMLMLGWPCWSAWKDVCASATEFDVVLGPKASRSFTGFLKASLSTNLGIRPSHIHKNSSTKPFAALIRSYMAQYTHSGSRPDDVPKLDVTGSTIVSPSLIPQGCSARTRTSSNLDPSF